LADSSNDRLTDGVVIDYQAYGTIAGGSFNLKADDNLGRTATHEVGHFFGLRHVWGDVSSCDPIISTDYVDDTPIQTTNYGGLCPTGIQLECGVPSMYDNYMNYTDDACMNIFSQGQVNRMDVVINNSPRRVSLLTSLGSQAPKKIMDDLGIVAILSPGSTACSEDLSPSIIIRNNGVNIVNSAQIQFYFSGALIETKTFSALNLLSSADTVINFSSVSVHAGVYDFSFKILKVSGNADRNNLRDSIGITTSIPILTRLPLVEPFDHFPVDWQDINADNLITWRNISLPEPNVAIYMNFHDYDNEGATDLLITPVIDLNSETIASLFFDLAYATRTWGSSDRLRILVSTACDLSSSPVEIFSKSGDSLSTALSTDTPFVPTVSQWVTNVVSLNQFLGKRIQITFEGLNGNGNNLYLDNVSISNLPSANSYSVYGGLKSPVRVAFNLPYKQLVRLQAYDVLGRIVLDNFLTETLNQTYSLDFPVGSTGLYIIRIQTLENISTTKVLLAF
jgi:hypothetical protein